MASNTSKQPKIAFRLSHMGDVALTTGVLNYWYETHGDSFIFVTRSGSAPLLEHHPGVTEVITLEDDALKGIAWTKHAHSLAKRFSSHTLLDLHGTLRSRILSFLWKGPIRRYPKFGLERRLYDRTHMAKYRRILEATNVAQRYAMALEETPPAAGMLTPRIFLTDDERNEASTMLSPLPAAAPCIALHPYATHPAKQWPRDHWIALAGLLEKNGYNWFVIGRDKTPLLHGDTQDYTNKTTLRATCALLAQASMLVTADSGPMHLASGVNTPVTALFGPTSKAWGFYPAGAHDTVLERDMECRPCSLHGSKGCEQGFQCLTGISPEDVLTHIQRSV